MLPLPGAWWRQGKSWKSSSALLSLEASLGYMSHLRKKKKKAAAKYLEIRESGMALQGLKMALSIDSGTHGDRFIVDRAIYTLVPRFPG